VEAIILAGGFGKRLKGLAGEVPKPMASINKKPFLDYLLNFLTENDVKKVIFSVFYKYEVLKKRYGSSFNGINIDYSIDDSALGTGGAIKNALSFTNEKDLLVLNGDTYFKVHFKKLFSSHYNNQNDITLSLKPMQSFDRYGIVKVGGNGKVISIKDKEYCKMGEIDGGVYIIKRNIFNDFADKTPFSFNDFLIKNLDNLKIGSIVFDNLFIDIGTPEDFMKAQNIFKKKSW